MQRLIKTFVACLIAVLTKPAAADPHQWTRGEFITAEVQRVLDGDTIEVNHSGARVHIRLYGIDAPENDQSCLDGQGAAFECGRAATRHLAELIGGRERPCPYANMHGICLTGSVLTECEIRDVDTRHRPHRPVGLCRVGPIDLSARMVSEGWAYPYESFSRDYVALGAVARLTGRGFWAGRFDDPAQFRRKRVAPNR